MVEWQAENKVKKIKICGGYTSTELPLKATRNKELRTQTS